MSKRFNNHLSLPSANCKSLHFHFFSPFLAILPNFIFIISSLVVLYYIWSTRTDDALIVGSIRYHILLSATFTTYNKMHLKYEMYEYGTNVE